MTDNQKIAIRVLQSGLRRLDGKWIWPVDVRADAKLADRFVASL